MFSRFRHVAGRVSPMMQNRAMHFGRPVGTNMLFTNRSNSLIKPFNRLAFRNFSAESEKQIAEVKGFVARNPKLVTFAFLVVLYGALDGEYGQGDNFYDYRFKIPNKDEDFALSLDDFYASEDFMQVWVVFGFVEKMMMRSSRFDDQGVCHTYGLSGNMEVSMEFKSSEEDGTSGNIVNYFNKAERFHDFQDLPVIGRVTLWDMVNDFGYTRTDDGTVEVYHKGTHWYGPWPMRLFFAIHGKYAIWATEKYVTSPHFGDSDKLEEAAAVRHFVPAYAMTDFLSNIEKDLKGAIDSKTRAGDKEGVLSAKATLKQIKKAKTMNLRNNTVMVKKMTGKKNEESTRANVQIDNPETQKAIQDALGHIADSNKSSSAVRDLVSETTAVSDK